jgi:hypothetical protein
LLNFELENADVFPAILAVTETWLSPEITESLIHIDGFNLFRNDRGSRGGGVALYVSQHMFSTNLIPTSCSRCELLCVDCYLKCTTRNKPHCIRCIVYYRPPVYDVEEMMEFCDILRSLICSDKQMLIVGDFNLPKINWSIYGATLTIMPYTNYF